MEPKCPKCQKQLNEWELIGETGIFTTPLNMVCECGQEFSVKAKAVTIEWEIKEVEDE